MPALEDLFSKWCSLLLQLEIKSTKITENTFALIAKEYSQTGRYYHDLQHIFHVLETIKILENLTNQLTSVELAAWFHDVVYDSKAQDNEEKSAMYATNLMKSLEIDSNTIANVNSLILSTKLHQADINDIDSQILLDADLAILGSPVQQYLTYAKNVRQEYAWVSDRDYQNGRRRFLEQFLQRKRIYYTDAMFEKLEQSARSNLTAELRTDTINFSI
ncbi:HD domain-containing protein [Mastigocoleus testarum]|uniref:HD domain-containing protein n=1 Tax=Mastigocoleus testarum BC008 TaxID=371196 RepID=A0A0V7ZHH9_9CYAN|nr:hypothetical protein [Mastigocoleus testarum]KST63879.1 hypothetical protein BC008_15610 [Mastigocoleus testarum BC008]KST64214.1 hypothetical protein BC008_16385 [Mastigocoleus testarum BC008]